MTDGTLRKRWFLPSTSFQSSNFCFENRSGLPSPGWCFLTHGPSGELKFAALSFFLVLCWVGGAGEHEVTQPLQAVQADRLAAWEWAGPGPGELSPWQPSLFPEQCL